LLIISLAVRRRLYGVHREELISYYKQLSDSAELRAAKAQWRVCRRRHDEKRTELLLSIHNWTAPTSDDTVEV